MFKPTDIEEQRFEISFRGYNTSEVDHFMRLIQEDYDEIYKEFEKVSKKITAAELKVQEANDRSNEFVESMKADREAADEYAAERRAEGERIIREAKNAAVGIMSEVKRRAAEVAKSAEESAASVVSGAKAEAERLIAEANTEANRILHKTQADAENAASAAKLKAKDDAEAIKADAKKCAEDAVIRASQADAYADKVYASAEKSLRDIERELRSAASAIALLARKPESVPKKFEVPAEAPAEESKTAEPAYTEKPEPVKSVEPEAEVSDNAPVGGSIAKGGYFTDEYRQAMAELFGENTGRVSGDVDGEDDDTYGYYDKNVLKSLREDMEEDSGGEVTSEYVSADAQGESLSGASVDSIYKAPDPDDIRSIFDNM